MKTLFAFLAFAIASPAFAVYNPKFGNGPNSNEAFVCYKPGDQSGQRYIILSDSYTTTGYGKWTGDIQRAFVVNEKTSERSEMGLVYSHGRFDSSLGTWRTDPRSAGQQMILDINGRASRGDVKLENVSTHEVYECFSSGDCC